MDSIWLKAIAPRLRISTTTGIYLTECTHKKRYETDIKRPGINTQHRVTTV